MIERPVKWHKGKQVWVGKDEYILYLKSKTWKNKKNKYKKSGFPTFCWACEAQNNIQFHHRTYNRLGWEPMSDIIPLCASCHNELSDEYKTHTSLDKNSLWNFTTDYVNNKRILLNLSPLSLKLFSESLITKPHNVMHKIVDKYYAK